MFKQILEILVRLKSYFLKNKTKLHNAAGFTLIELLVIISVIGFLTMASVLIFNIVRMNARDAVRSADIATIQRALAIYLNESGTGYPASAGECLSDSLNVGQKLKEAQSIKNMPVDPLYPTVSPSNVSDTGPNIGTAISPSSKFCYYYYSNYFNQFKISYYLESNSKAGSAGINTVVVAQ